MAVIIFSLQPATYPAIKLMLLEVVFAKHCALCDITKFAPNGPFKLKELKRHDKAIFTMTASQVLR